MKFETLFEKVTGHPPFPWQRRLHREFVNGRFPESCALPTGLGKTSVIPIWLLALAESPDRVPRRLVYVVNRRTVVDQATNEVEKLRESLTVTSELRERIKELCANSEKCPLGVSTLRGQFADNAEWRSDPTRPAVIAGTVDMIGSRLLFGGYGLGFKTKPMHAGFLGQDVLLIHDEAHLEPAFQQLVVGICEEQQRCHEFRQLHLMEMTATSRSKTSFGLEDDDRENEIIRKRITARKTVTLHPCDDVKEIADRLSDLALLHRKSKQTVLVFARTVDAVEKVAVRLGKAKQNVRLLTGTIRGKERDELIGTDEFARFLPGEHPGNETSYLVCTSAGEVGINISADQLVCDLSTFDSMSQRFGRVNRFGLNTDTRVDIVHPCNFDLENEYEERLNKTLKLLQLLDSDASPEALSKLAPSQRQEAFAPPPTILPVTDILFDAWSLTSIREPLPGRPPLQPWLHGVSAWEEPQTRVAWRDEVEVFSKLPEGQLEPKDLLDDYPLKPHEILRDRSDRVLKHLSALAAQDPEVPIWVVRDNESVDPLTMGELTAGNKERIHNCMVLLAPSAGGLGFRQGISQGLLNGSAPYDANHRALYDVADEWFEDSARDIRRRVRIWSNDPALREKCRNMRLIRRIVLPPSENAEDEPTRSWLWYELPRSGDTDGSKTSTHAVSLEAHTADVVKQMRQFTDSLGLAEELRQALEIAAECHDWGKRREHWQRMIGNPQPSDWLANPSGKMRPLPIRDHYRHELGSLVDVQGHAGFRDLSEPMKDLVMHLIAAHHGRARPHFFPDEIIDPGSQALNVSDIAIGIPSRFARLQKSYGRWGLAWLESLLRAADYAASAEPGESIEEES